ncbi:DUF429 domain-containing protein [Thermotoga sp. SG1]|uniref:DUF429 domain-containing protein n=1 Tax=Thermotoga sp. SG1 TaxID=126739 RepID=UPI001E396BAB|nr:DUF429 domain-containing protein [Thermotoga sp. SG1]
MYVLVEERKILKIGLMERFLFPGFPVLVDIPIGLPETGERVCDELAQKILSKRAGCVFTVPVRKAVYQKTYEEALRVNRKKQGKGFPVQFWNIVGKVREVDLFLRENPSLVSVISESHPELCFLKLSGRLLASKHTKEGIKQRINVLNKFLTLDVNELKKNGERLKVPLHDLLDAMVLALSGQFSLETIPENPPKDRYGLPMGIKIPVFSEE